MAKNDNAHAIRLGNSIKKVDEGFAEEFERKYPLSKTANMEQKFDWAINACNYLEDHFTEEQVIDIRKECRCNDGKSNADKMMKYLKKGKDLKSFVDLFNENESFAHLEYRSENKILFCYPECYCSCVKHVPRELSKAWCYCTVGNAQGVFEKLFQKKVKIELLESIKSGNNRCAMEVEILS